MKNYAWFKHPKDLSNDKRVSALIDQEGGRGYGTYLYIIETLYMQPDGKLNFQQLRTMQKKGFGKMYMEKVIRNYKLFLIKGNEFWSVINYNSLSNECEKTADNLPANSPESSNELSTNYKTPSSSEEKKICDNNQIISHKRRKPALARVREEKIREEQNREEQRDGQPAATAVERKTFGSWRTLIDDLEPESEWKEIVCMKSGFGMLLKKHFKVALEIFKGHVVLHAKERNICTREDARSYFANYSRQGQFTSNDLRKALLAIDSVRQTDDPYRYEQIANGRRTYLGCPIPDGAPPRPNATAFWNEATQSWATQ